ncbi:MAG: hypothetical protein KDI38_07920 [Calditrichaeota bacterium]|nr:hypothetical protein [Calditrichota bacterium]MCB0294978.1 hypothetical protein [Calditrichota bacterium]MCB0303689.1 hypothetical protein [Calditrichota bacterium]MCB0313137.1 hypothetical protein [Calditrichota bacterium]
MRRFYKWFPLLAIPLACFNLELLLMGRYTSDAAKSAIAFNFLLPSNDVLQITLNGVLLILAVVILFFEICKSTSASTVSIVEHALSVMVFIIFLMEFLLMPGLGTAEFLLTTLISLVDVLAGITVSITAARRDFQISR